MNATIEHGQLFKPEMVRSILLDVDPKTQTRRLPTAHNSLVDGLGMSQKRWDAMGFDFARAWVDKGPSPAGNPGPYLQVPAVRNGEETVHRIYPRVQPGHFLWVRESAWYDREIIADIGTTRCFFPGRDVRFADGRSGLAPFECSAEILRLNASLKCRPGIHMPRWASRIYLEVTGMRVERLQDISYEDALAEGVPDYRGFIEHECGKNESADACARRLRWPQREYALLWNKINGAGAWEANPWVWVVEFKRVKP